MNRPINVLLFDWECILESFKLESGPGDNEEGPIVEFDDFMGKLNEANKE